MLDSTSHAGAAQPWCLVGHIFSCHDSAAPKPLFAECRRSSNWGRLYSSTTERIFIPSRPLVTKTSARSFLIGLNFTECCLWRTINSTHKGVGTPVHPGDRFGPDEEGYFSETSVLPLPPLADIPIKKDAAFLHSQPCVVLYRQLFCALTLPGLDFTQAGWSSKGSHCYLERGHGRDEQRHKEMLIWQIVSLRI